MKILRSALVPIIAVVLALLVGALLIQLSGSSPREAYAALFEGSYMGWENFGTTLEKATPLIMGGLAVGTFLIIYLIPCLYVMAEKRRGAKNV